jgi:hypothetical protein
MSVHSLINVLTPRVGGREGSRMVKKLLLIAISALTFALPLLYAGPQLATDLKVGGRWTLVNDLSIDTFKCTRWYLVVTTCDIKYVNRVEPDRAGGNINYLVLGSWSGERARLLRAATDSEQIGTTIGQEHMQQRLISFGIFVLIFLAFMIAIVRSSLRTRAITRAVQ